jgi:hypothetical protein
VTALAPTLFAMSVIELAESLAGATTTYATLRKGIDVPNSRSATVSIDGHR